MNVKVLHWSFHASKILLNSVFDFFSIFLISHSLTKIYSPMITIFDQLSHLLCEFFCIIFKFLTIFLCFYIFYKFLCAIYCRVCEIFNSFFYLIFAFSAEYFLSKELCKIKMNLKHTFYPTIANPVIDFLKDYHPVVFYGYPSVCSFWVRASFIKFY